MGEIFRFEVRFRFRQVSTYIFFAVLFALAMLFISTDVVQIGGGDGRVKGNAPYVLAFAGTVLTGLGAIIASALMGTAIYRDFEANAHELFFTTRLTKRDYLIGRYLGAFLVTLFVFSGLPLGFLAGTVAPWADKANFGAFRIDAYLSFYALYLIPNLLFIGALFFILGALTRNLLAIYAQGILLFIGWSIAVNLMSSMENRNIAALLDPFGISAMSVATRYWTLAEKNESLLPVVGPILWNRLLWLGVGFGIFAIGYRLFQFSKHALVLRKAGKEPGGGRGPRTTPENVSQSLPVGPGATSPAGNPSSVYPLLTRFYLREILRGVPFLVITLAGILLLFVNALNADKIFDTTVYPVTRVIMEQVAASFTLFFLILITFYAGELAWRERTLRLDQISDALPVKTATTVLAKVTALLLTLAFLMGVLLCTGILVQMIKGYFNFEIPVYFAYLYGTVFPGLACLTLFAFFVHALVNNKFLGHTVVVLNFIATAALPSMGLSRQLYLFDGGTSVTYSDMNKFGPFLTPFYWYTLYWTCFSVLLLMLALKIWVRGKDDTLALRWKKGQMGPVATGIAGVAALGFIASGVFIYYNTDILNTYRTSKMIRRERANYEKTYKATWEKKPMPRITDVKMDVDLHPETRSYTVTGQFRLKNKTNKPISEIALQTDQDLTYKKLEFGVKVTSDINDKKTGFRTYKLTSPLAPGAETTLDFVVADERKGFPNGSPNTAIAGNGTFVTMPGPSIGYQPGGEITDENDRRKEELPKRRRMAPYTDMAARQNTYLGNDADWISFEATVRTAPDQIALAPGYLQKEWTENGRHCFTYKMDAPIRNFYSFLSAKYAVKKDTWTAKDGKKVALEIYYHPTHTYNLDRMMKGMKAALTYCSDNFGPYQFRQARILEFPAYAQFAQSFPNTIPYSESIGFIARVNDDDEDIDYPYYVTAHEVAHQWWAHQVLGGNVEGSEMLSESLAEYSALMIMKKEYGPNRLRRFLRYDLDRYLDGRGSEREDENPLVKVQNQQYIHYPKGALVFASLADQIGEEQLNATLARFIKDKGFQEPPYTTGMELLDYLRKDVKPEYESFLTDQFEKITVFDLRATEVKSEKLDGGKYKVTVKVSAAKSYSDGAGHETPAPINDTFDIGVFAKPEGKVRDKNAIGKPLAFERRPLTKAEETFTFTVDSEPFKAGIDPYNKRIDRRPDDNVKAVEK